MRTHMILALLAGAILTGAASRGSGATPPTETPVPDALAALPPGAIRLGGRLGDALDACIRNRVLAQDLPMLVDPFRDHEERTTWRIEFWGKWFTSGALACRYAPMPALRAKLDEAVRALLAPSPQMATSVPTSTTTASITGMSGGANTRCSARSNPTAAGGRTTARWPGSAIPGPTSVAST